MNFPVSGVDCSPLLPPLVAFVISFFTSMGGVSGAFLLLPIQVSVLGFTSPAVSPTNLVYNIVAIPSGVYRYIREGRMAWPLAWVIIIGTLPGVFIGAILRIKYLPDPRAFKLFVGCVLLYIGVQLLFKTLSQVRAGKEQPGFQDSPPYHREETMTEKPNKTSETVTSEEAVVRTIRFTFREYEYEFWGRSYSFNPVVLFIIAFVVGIIGGTYGIGGGSIIAPFCVALLGLPVYTVAGAALLGTFLTSIVGIVYYYAAAVIYKETALAISPDWALGLLFGIGGFIGMYCGARVQKFVPEKWIKLVLGLLIAALAVKYIVQFF